MKNPPRQRLSKHTLFLGEGQFDRLAALHPNIPASEIIRRLIDAYLDKAEKVLPIQAPTITEETTL
jgi:hypothetical protein